jgi:hypothetical protein
VQHAEEGAASGAQHTVPEFAADRASAVAVIRALAGGQEGFPGDARRIVDPGFFGPGIAAVRVALFEDMAARCLQPPIDLVQLGLILNLNPEVIEPGSPPRVEIAKFTLGSSSIHFA